ncbi:MAG: hypothetical protein HOI95_05670 [Chromatiales bacterium]|nr:hypothetical protein [Chromatiales bacterium]
MSEKWIALAGTPDLPIVEGPVREAAQGVASVHVVPVPYKPLSPTEEEQVVGMLRGAGGILLRSGYVTASLLDRLPALQVVAVHGTGVDPVDVPACTERGVWVTNAPSANAVAVAELTIGLMVALLRRFSDAAHQVRQHREWDAARHTGGELGGRRLGLFGIGDIGQRVARLASAFGMSVMAHDPGLIDEQICTRGAIPASQRDVFEQADVISLHAPAIAATRHMVNAETLGWMKSSALLVNCARGALVDEVAVAAALTEGRLGGAALDVLEGEPPDPSSPVFDAPNIILTPHMAGSTHECLQTIARVAGADLVRVLSGLEPLNAVNQIR